MLYNKVVPVQHPQRPIRSYPGLHRGHPFICTGKDVPAVNLLVSRAIRFYNGAVHQVPGWFAYKSYPVPILLGKLTGCIKMKACGSGKTTPYIYLAYFFGDGMHIIMPVNFFTSGYPFLVSFPFSPFMAFIIAQRNTHINGMGIIGSRTKYIEGFIKSKS